MKVINVEENLKKNITFYCEDILEEHLVQPLLEKFSSKNYKVRISNDFQTKSEIGYYCSPSNNIKSVCSKFSIISLGGMDQGKLYWPNFWYKEPWAKFDLGVLPGLNWTNMWKKSSWYDKANPKYGVVETGWPKTSFLKKYTKNDKMNILNSNFNILYAPCFETDNKGIDIVNIVKDLDVNLIIKHLPWSTTYEKKKFKDVRKNISQMIKYAKKNLLKKVFIISTKKNIFDYFSNADLLITDESSLIYESLLFEIPVLSCSSWIMRGNNTVVPRKIKKDENVCIYVKKKDLKEKISSIRYNYSDYKSFIIDRKKKHFSNIDNSVDVIFDLVNEIVENKMITKCIKPSFKINLTVSFIYNPVKKILKLFKDYSNRLIYKIFKIVYF